MIKNQINWIENRYMKGSVCTKTSTDFLSKAIANEVRRFHKTFPQYYPTPIVELEQLANNLGIKKIWVKDESKRFGLNAFKVLGGSYAIAKYMAKILNTNVGSLSFDKLNSAEIKEKIGEVTFVTATDGNHGKGIAWAAQQLGQKAVVYMPKGSSQERLKAIQRCGANAMITEWNYDDTVRFAAKQAEKYGWQLIQDTAWGDYKEIPTWIMQGYSTIANEIQEQLALQGEMPTHILLQAGVGSFAASILGYYVNVFQEKRPITVIVEPEDAACMYKSATIGDGCPHAVKGDLNTIMAGLACGEPNPIAWDILRDYSNAFVACPDNLAEMGMRILAHPIEGDEKVISGESGAVGIGLLNYLLKNKNDYAELLDQLKLTKESKVLVISTEGDTDPENYKRIINKETV